MECEGDISLSKSKSLTKEETKLLVSLIEKSKVVNNRKTNATTNRMKTEEWDRITDTFNATIGGICSRTPQQLRLKWENLKKNARKRSTQIKMARLKSGGGPPVYFPPDEVLDRVSTMLSNSREGLNVSLGGDAVMSDCGDSSGEVVNDGGETDPKTATAYYNENPGLENEPSTSKTGHEDMDDVLQTILKKLSETSGGKRKSTTVDGALARNTAIAEYFITKKKLIDIKIESKSLEKEKRFLDNERIKIELERFKLENERYRLENNNLKIENENLKLANSKLKHF
uniref:Regulatory protein zeste n=1 Tax=Heliothis virescens TaxID=7102 RepID=A0A2A4IVT0_HELVI